MKPEDLKRHDCLAYIFSPRSEWRSAQAVWKLIGRDGDVRIPVDARLQTDSAEGLRRAALAGMGIVILPEMLVSEDIAAGRLVRLLRDYALPVRPVSLIYLRDRRMSSKLRSFVDFVVDRFSDDT